MTRPTPAPTWLERIDRDLARRAEASLRRQWRLVPEEPDRPGRPRLIRLADNDYLRLRRHPHLIARVCEAAQRAGAGSGSSRLVDGTSEAHLALEARFARFKHAQGALLFPTGYMANIALVSSLAQEDDLVVLDKHSHASLIDGARLASAQGAMMRTYPHGRTDRLAALLAAHRRDRPGRLRLIVTDSVFSMGGDVADLDALAALRDEHEAVLIVDEAHATGVLGPGGCGADVKGLADATVSTASKALGSLGGLVTGPRLLIEWLINAARPFLFTTAPPPAQVAAIDAALDLVESEPQRRERLASNAAALRARLREAGFDVRDDPTPIVPIIVGASEQALALADHLRAHGILAPAIRPPTVAPNAARVRLSVHCELTEEEVDRIGAAVRSFPRSPGE